MAKSKPADWRSKPRKPATERKTYNMSVRITPDELRRLKRGARAAKVTIRDFIILHALERPECQ